MDEWSASLVDGEPVLAGTDVIGQMATIGMHPTSGKPHSFDTNATLRWSPPNCQLELTGRNLWNRIVVDAPIDPLNPELGCTRGCTRFLGTR